MSCKTFRETLIDQYQEISTIKFLTKQAVRIWARIHTNIHTDKFVYDLGFSCNSSQIVPSRRQFWLLASLSVRLGFDWWVPQSGFVRCSSSHWCFVLSNRHWVLTVFFIQAPIQFANWESMLVTDWKMPRSCAMLDILFGMVATIGLDSEELATVEAVTSMQYQNKMD